MRNKPQKHTISDKLDDFIGFFSPLWSLNRKKNRFAYEGVDKTRTRRNRGKQGGTGDSELTEDTLSDLRDSARDMGRNNPVVKGMLQTERDGVIGPDVMINANTNGKQFNDRADKLWQEEMVDSPCDITGRFNINQYTRKGYLSYRRDGDFETVKHEDEDNKVELEPVEGQQIGTPNGQRDFDHFTVTNGIAFSKKNRKIVGYFIGTPDKWGYISAQNVRNVPADKVHSMMNADMFSYSRGEPILSSSIKYIDKIDSYIDAELTAAMVNACFSMAITSNTNEGAPDAFTEGVSSDGTDLFGNRLEKINPGQIMYLKQDEKAEGIGQMSPGQMFDTFTLRILSFIGAPMCMPLMLITKDYAGATFMNARIAYQKVQELWIAEQVNVVHPFINRIWRWKIEQWIKQGKLKDREDKFANLFIPNRWPYVDPFKEAKADEQQIKNRTTNRTMICQKQGTNFKDVNEGLIKEDKLIPKPETEVIDNGPVQSENK